jgi:CBS domain-containing protein
MADAGVGTLVVLGQDRRPAGVLSDRDVAIRCVAQCRDPDVTSVASVMSAPVAQVHESTPIESALARMAGARLRRLVVVADDGQLVGILALDDVLERLVEEFASIGKLLLRRSPAPGPL